MIDTVLPEGGGDRHSPPRGGGGEYGSLHRYRQILSNYETTSDATPRHMSEGGLGFHAQHVGGGGGDLGFHAHTGGGVW